MIARWAVRWPAQKAAMAAQEVPKRHQQGSQLVNPSEGNKNTKPSLKGLRF